MQDEYLRILIVDDTADATNSLAFLLRMAGHQTSTALNGASAIAAAESFKPDVILLDIGLPDINGYEVCKTVRTQEWGKHIWIIAITGWGIDYTFSSSVEAGFDHHLVKPVEFTDLCKYLTESRPQMQSRAGLRSAQD